MVFILLYVGYRLRAFSSPSAQCMGAIKANRVRKKNKNEKQEKQVVDRHRPLNSHRRRRRMNKRMKQQTVLMRSMWFSIAGSMTSPPCVSLCLCVIISIEIVDKRKPREVEATQQLVLQYFWSPNAKRDTNIKWQAE